MHIHGLQKLAMVDYPGKLAATVFTGGCNLRCPFCHNALLVTRLAETPEIPEQEVLDFLASRRGLLDGVVLTGGEPLLQPDAADFLRKVRELGFAVKLDTNGSFPEKLKKIVSAGLVDYVAMDIKNSRESYGKTIGIEGYDTGNVEKSIQYLMSGSVPYEFRTTVVQEFHQRTDFESIGKWIEGADKYYLQQFVDSGDLIQDGLHGYNKDIMNQALEVVKKSVQTAELRGL